MMYCRYCGKELRTDSVFCAYCGKRIVFNNQPIVTEQKSRTEKPLGLRWMKFFTVFILLCTALSNGYDGYSIFKDIILDSQGYFAALPAYKMLNIIYGCCYIVLTIFTLAVRHDLNEYKAGAPEKARILYFIQILFYLWSLFLASKISGQQISELITYYALMTVSGDLILIIINSAYFKKREHLFVN